MADLTGKVFAMLCAGSDDDRAIAVALSEAGADIALGTVSQTKEQEFATASIANEVWSIGREQFTAVLDARDSATVAAFAAEVARRLGTCDGLVISTGGGPLGPLEMHGNDAWLELAREHVVAVAVAVQAFAPAMAAPGNIHIVVTEPDEFEGTRAALRKALTELARDSMDAWREERVAVRALTAAELLRRIAS